MGTVRAEAPGMSESAPAAAGGQDEYVGGGMRVLKARVRGGRLVLDEPTDLPEGSEVELLVMPEDELDPEERTRLLEAIEEGARDIERGDYVDGAEFIAQLRARRAAANR
jgi:hypothetical protein